MRVWVEMVFLLNLIGCVSAEPRLTQPVILPKAGTTFKAVSRSIPTWVRGLESGGNDPYSSYYPAPNIVQDINSGDVTEVKFQRYKEVGNLNERQDTFLIMQGMYAWFLFTKTMDDKWKVQSETYFQRASDQGINNPYSICSESWTLDLKIKWQSVLNNIGKK